MAVWLAASTNHKDSALSTDLIRNLRTRPAALGAAKPVDLAVPSEAVEEEVREATVGQLEPLMRSTSLRVGMNLLAGAVGQLRLVSRPSGHRSRKTGSTER